MSSVSQNRIEKANEVFTLFSTYLMIIFTDFILDVEYRYSLGSKSIGAIILVILLNITIVFYDIISGIIFQFKKKRHEIR